MNRRTRRVGRSSASDQSGAREYFMAVATAFGSVMILWRDRERGAVVSGIALPADVPSIGESIRQRMRMSCPLVEDLASRIRAFCSGENVSIEMDMLDLSICGMFQQLVLKAEHAIPRGKVSTYGRIARHIGHPGAARAVGTALAKNPFPLVIPCHRAVREDGRLGGFRGGTAMKRRLLELEGVAFTGRGTVLMNLVYY
jgi:methylated-DNA-[protein]-cysteine S-methyltransferase